MKIGILTYHGARNYGAYLQGYALAATLKEKGHDVEIIDFNMKKAQRYYFKVKFKNKNPMRTLYNLKLERVFKRERKNLPLSKDKLISDDMKEFQDFVKDKYDCIVVGSDEIWKIDSFRGFPTPYWLEGNLGCEKLAYAASSRSNIEAMEEKDHEYLKKAVNEFRYVSVRDKDTYNQIEKVYQKKDKLSLVCDPTYLYDFKASKERGLEIIKKRIKYDEKLPILLIMANQKDMVAKLNEKFKGKANLVGLYYYQKGIQNIGTITPFEWIDVIAAGDFLVTNYFHGMCFAIKSNVNFVAVEARKERSKAGKMYDLLDRENLGNNFIKKKQGYFDKLVEKIENGIGKKVDFSETVIHQKQLSQKFFEEIDTIQNQANKKNSDRGKMK